MPKIINHRELRDLNVSDFKVLIFGNVQINLTFRSLNRTLDLTAEGTRARKFSNKFGISLA